jgi:hypothetical protein
MVSRLGELHHHISEKIFHRMISELLFRLRLAVVSLNPAQHSNCSFLEDFLTCLRTTFLSSFLAFRRQALQFDLVYFTDVLRDPHFVDTAGFDVFSFGS